MKRNLVSLQAGRGIAALLVVLFHAQLVIAAARPGSVFCRLFAGGYAGVDFFFVLSGFLMMYVHHRDFDQPSRLRHYFWKRLVRIYPVYWAVCLVVLPMAMATPSAVHNASKFSASALIPSLLLLPHGGGRIIGVTWSLEYEILFYALFSLFLVSRRLGSVVFGLWVGELVAHLAIGPANLDPAGILDLKFRSVDWIMNPRCLEFVAGMVVALVVQRGWVRRAPGWMLWAGLSGSFGLLAMDGVWGFSERVPTLAIGLYGACAVTLVLVCAVREQTVAMRVPGWLNLLGSASYAIYLTHFTVVAVARTVAEKKPGLWGIPSAAIFLFVAAIALLPGLLVHRFVERPLMLRLTRRKVAELAVAPH